MREGGLCRAGRHDRTPRRAIDALLAEHADLERQLADPALHTDAGKARKVGRRFAALAPIVATYRKLEAARGDLEAARELAADDESFAAEVDELAATGGGTRHPADRSARPRDPHDADDILLEVKSGEGGEESALFAADLARMYIRYAERHGWTVTMLDETTSDLGGYKDATLSIAGKGDAADGVWSRLKFEGGVHRVQRVPVTESQGRVHTSAAGVLVYPGARGGRGGADRRVRSAYRRLPVVRQGRPGRQHHRLGGAHHAPAHRHRRHLPERTLAAAEQGPRLQVLAARLQSLAEEQALADASADRASQIRTVDRSERIRTYNFPENRIADHRINFKAHNLDQVLDGDLDALFDALAAADKQSRLATGMTAPAPREAIDAAARRWPTRESARRGCRCRAARRARGRHRPPAGFTRRPRRRILRAATTSSSRARASGYRCNTSPAPPRSVPVTVHVGPVCSFPRPETEALLEWAVAQPASDAAGDRRPVHGLRRARARAVTTLARRARHRRRRLRRRAGLCAPQRGRHTGRTAARRRDRTRTARRNSTAGSISSSPTRPTFPTARRWNPKWPNMIRRTRCSAGRTG